ncbi:MAG: tail fiber domain-containing protein [Candidatus Pacebacteria bacterium]|nr:tail fiber domain-containing protein [Candidatus Paceibacterota bacterium]
MKLSSLHKPLIITIFTLALLSYGFIVVNAAYPATQWEPAETLDPTCSPGDANCSVANAWQLDLTNGYVFNDTDLVGIGTDTPTVELTIAGEISQTATLPSGGLGLFTAGDLSAVGGVEGYNFIAVDSFTPTAVGIMRLDLNTNEPEITLRANSPTYSTSVTLDSSDGSITVDTDEDIFINAADDLFIGSSGAWYGGVNDGTTDLGTYRSDFSHDPFNATPAIVWELKNNQNYAMGFAALDDVGNKRYANIFYGELDSNNIITDITRIEATDGGATSTFMYDTLNGYTNTIDMNASGTYFDTVDANGTNYFQLLNNGDASLVRSTDGVGLTVTDDDNSCTIDPDTGVSCSSDRRLKTDINELTSGLDLVMQLNPVTYHWIANPDQVQNYGFIAQEVEEIMPELVSTSPNGKLLLNQGLMMAPIVSAIQTLQQQITDGAAVLIDTVKEIFVKKVTTEELCIEDLCFDRQEAEMLKQLISDGVVTEYVQEEIVYEEEVISEVVEEEISLVNENEEESNEVPGQNQQTQELESEPEIQEDVMLEPEQTEDETMSEIPQEEVTE